MAAKVGVVQYSHRPAAVLKSIEVCCGLYNARSLARLVWTTGGLGHVVRLQKAHEQEENGDDDHGDDGDRKSRRACVVPKPSEIFSRITGCAQKVVFIDTGGHVEKDLVKIADVSLFLKDKEKKFRAPVIFHMYNQRVAIPFFSEATKGLIRLGMSPRELVTDKFGDLVRANQSDSGMVGNSRDTLDGSHFQSVLYAAAISSICAFLLLRLCEPPFIYEVPHELGIPRISLTKLVHGSLSTALLTALLIVCVPRSSAT